VLPEVLPWVLAGSGERRGIVSVGGYTETPLRVKIYGPTTATTLTNPKITAPGFHLELSGGFSLGAGQVVTVDTRTRTATRGGTSVAGFLTPNSRLGARLLPGSTEFTFTGNDSSYTSEVEFLWRTAEYSI
jgi:hypothetical protein